MAKQTDPALVAIREKYKQVTGKEPGATLGIKQLADAIKKFQEENTGDENANDPYQSGAEGSDQKGETGKDPNENQGPGKEDKGGAEGSENEYSNIDTSNHPNIGWVKEIEKTKGFLMPPGSFDSPFHYVGYILDLATKDLALTAKETLGVIKFMAMFDPHEEAADAYEEVKVNLARKIAEDEAASIPLKNPAVNYEPITKDDLQTEMVTIRHTDGRPQKQISRITWEKFLSHAPGGWSLIPEIPAEIKSLK